MGMIKDRLVFLRTKARLTQVELAEKILISDKVISKWENGDTEPSIEQLRTLAKLYNVSFDYLVEGTANEHDKVILNRPATTGELADDYLKQCYEIIKERKLLKYKDILIPKKIIGRAKPDWGEHVTSLAGGVFRGDNYWEWQNVYMPFLDIGKLLMLDNYDIYVAMIDLPATFGEMRYLMKLRNDVDGLKATEPKNRSSNAWTSESPKPSVSVSDIKHLTDVRFVKIFKNEVNLNEWLANLSPTNKNYWAMIKVLIENGAVCQKVIGFSEYQQSLVFGPDHLQTSMLLEIAKKTNLS